MPRCNALGLQITHNLHTHSCAGRENCGQLERPRWPQTDATAHTLPRTPNNDTHKIWRIRTPTAGANACTAARFYRAPALPPRAQRAWRLKRWVHHDQDLPGCPWGRPEERGWAQSGAEGPASNASGGGGGKVVGVVCGREMRKWRVSGRFNGIYWKVKIILLICLIFRTCLKSWLKKIFKSNHSMIRFF